jgi:hypothetical protein
LLCDPECKSPQEFFPIETEKAPGCIEMNGILILGHCSRYNCNKKVMELQAERLK